MSNSDIKSFTVYWLNGKKNILEGDTIEDAFNRAGYGNGAVRAVDFYSNGICNEYSWNNTTRQWDRITPVISTYCDMGMQEIVDKQQSQSETDYYSEI